jgi:hypothetical protein
MFKNSTVDVAIYYGKKVIKQKDSSQGLITATYVQTMSITINTDRFEHCIEISANKFQKKSKHITIMQ